MAGNISVVGRYQSEVVFARSGGSFTLSAGQTADIYGFCRSGFDGSDGGAASMTLAAGSSLRFMPTIRLDVTGLGTKSEAIARVGTDMHVSDWLLPFHGSVITGQTSGATGLVIKHMDTQVDSGRRVVLTVVALDGVFEAGEDLHCDALTMRQRFTYPGGVFGQVRIAPEYVLGSLGKVNTGLNGFDAQGLTAGPNVNATVNLGGDLHVDVTGLANGTYDLIDVDTVSGAFDAITAAGNAAKDLTFTFSASQVQMSVVDGSGQISG